MKGKAKVTIAGKEVAVHAGNVEFTPPIDIKDVTERRTIVPKGEYNLSLRSYQNSEKMSKILSYISTYSYDEMGIEEFKENNWHVSFSR